MKVQKRQVLQGKGNEDWWIINCVSDLKMDRRLKVVERYGKYRQRERLAKVHEKVFKIRDMKEDLRDVKMSGQGRAARVMLLRSI